MSTYTQDITHLIGKINTNLPDNDTQAITAARIRDAMGAVAYNYDLYVLKSQLSQELDSYVLKTDLDTAGYVTQSQLSESSYVTASQLEGLVTDQELQEGMQSVHDDAYAYVVEKINEIPGVDLSAYVSKIELSEMGYVTESSLGDYVTETELSSMGYITENDLPDMSAYVSQDDLQSALEPYVTESQLQQAGYVTESQLTSMSYATKAYVADYVASHSGPIDLSSYVTKDELSAAGYLTAVPSEYVTESEIASMGYITEAALGDYVTTTSLQSALEPYVTETELSQAGYITETELSNVLSTASYVTQNELSNAGYINTQYLEQASYVTQQALSGMGYLTAVPSEYVTESQLQSTLTAYITESELSGIGYITASYAATYYLDYTSFGDYTSWVQDTLIDANILITDPETGDWTPQAMASETYVAEYVASYAPTPDLSAYVTKTELSAAGYLTAVPSEYITETELSSMGYITSSDIPSIPVIDENLIPNTTLTYTLGDSTHYYDATYTNRVNGPSEGMVFRLGDTGKVALYSAAFRPASNDSMSLGTTNQKWSTTYSYEYNFGFNTRLYSSSDYNVIVRIGNNRYQFDNASFVHFDNSTTSSLGTSSKQWGYTYSAYFIENGTNISDIYATKTQLNAKQDALVSGTNIKTINNESLLGSGNIDIQAGGTPDYSHVLTFTATQANSTIRLERRGSDTSMTNAVLEYSTDGGETWNDYTIGNTITLATVGSSVMFKGTNETLGITASNYHQFSMSGKIKASGDVTSLLNGVGGDCALKTYCFGYLFYGCSALTQAPELPSTKLGMNCYFSMFQACTSLTEAPELPAKTLMSSCYQSMFSGCTSLTKAPVLPATTLEAGCYNSMFSGCTSLREAPELPATSLARYCYASMFQNCVSLIKAPVLPAINLIQYCYQAMFSGCSNLHYVKAMFTYTPSNTYTQDWLKQVSTYGTFVKSNDATWTNTGTNAVPILWTVYKAVSVDTDDVPESYVEDNGKGLQVVNGAWQKVSGLLTSANLIYDSTTNTLTINV